MALCLYVECTNDLSHECGSHRGRDWKLIVRNECHERDGVLVVKSSSECELYLKGALVLLCNVN